MGNINATGLNQPDLVDLLVLFRGNFNGILAKLDADTGVTDTDYASLNSVSIPAGIETKNPKAIHDQGATLSFLNSVLTNYNAVLSKLDADAGVTDTDYNSSLAITDTIDNPSAGHLRPSGMFQGSLINLLDVILTRINSLNAKLDADGGVADTNYAALFNIADTVDSARTYA